MLQIHPEKVCFIITNAKEFQAQEEVSAEDAGASSGEHAAGIIISDFMSTIRWLVFGGHAPAAAASARTRLRSLTLS